MARAYFIHFFFFFALALNVFLLDYPVVFGPTILNSTEFSQTRRLYPLPFNKEVAIHGSRRHHLHL